MKQFLNIVLSIVITFAILITTAGPVQAASLTVTPSLKAGVYYTDNSLSVSLATYPGATIVYTTNGSTPSAKMSLLGILTITNGIKYTGTLSLSKTTTIKAMAVKRYFQPSATYTFKYEVYSPTRLAESVRIRHSGFIYTDLSKYPNPTYYTASDGSKGNLVKWNNGSINCTWYAFNKLKYYNSKGILFTSAGGVNGNQWYSKAVSSTTQIKYGGNNGLEALISANSNRPVYNIIVSFERNGTGTAGHVMLVDAIINGVVYYSDNSKPGVFLTKSSISAFKNAYLSYNGQIVGVVQIK